MAASPQTVTTTPLFLTANTNVHNARDFRRQISDVIGSGVADYDSFRIRQRAAGANMSIDGMTASVLNRAYVRGSVTTDAGVYRVDFNSATPINVDIAASDPTNPRIDSVYLAVEDSQETGSNNKATLRVVTGTATGGATLDNRTGAGPAPSGMSSILLADVLVAASDTSITNAEIRDRRPFGLFGAGPSTFTALDAVQFQDIPGVATGTQAIQNTATFDSQQGCALMFLPRRIVNATKIRFRYGQGSTANTGNYNIGIYDASGRQIVTTGAVAYTGTANQTQVASLTITTTTFDAGNYWIVIGNGAGTASAIVNSWSVLNITPNAAGGPHANLFGYSTTGGTTLPTTILSFVDAITITGAGVTRVSVPIIALSVG